MDATTGRGLGKYGPIEVFRAGNFTAMGGSRQIITRADLQGIAASYDRDLAPAPVVIGHPDTDTPAFGWVETLYIEGDVLKATLEDTAAEFAEQVKAGRYRKIFISLFLPNSANNPKPGSMYLKHVGFLGAVAPAVPGLKPVRFTGGDDLFLTQDNPAVAFSQGDELHRLRCEVRDSQIERLISQGRALPAFKADLVSFAASLDDRETVSFAEAGDRTRLAWFLDYLSKQPKVVSFGAMDLGPDPFSAQARRQVANVPGGYTADRTHDAVYNAARQIEREKGISFAGAVNAVLDGGPGA